jgi:serine/threonine-protein kinase
MVGEVIEHYKILQRIGEGGMGTVYRALDTMLEREVALKLLRADLSGEPEVTQRFRAEAVALARLSHPHIATLFGLVRRDAQFCMVMELVRGETLAALMKAEGPFSCERACRLAMQILAALDYAHESGIVHRDVKPSNVIVAPSGVAKVLDFGIARVLDADRVTRQGLVVGTPQYMAPEQIRGEPIDGRADVYAAGVLLYEMIAARLPFNADTGVALMYAHLEGAVTPIEQVAPHVPAWLAGVVHRAIARMPADRYRAGELRQALDAGLSTGVVVRPHATTGTLLPAQAARAAPPPTPPPAARSTNVETGPQATELDVTVVNRPGARGPADAAPSIDVFREPPAAPASLPGRPATGRRWMVGGAVAAVALGAAAIWAIQSRTAVGPTTSGTAPPADAARPAASAPVDAPPPGSQPSAPTGRPGDTQPASGPAVTASPAPPAERPPAATRAVTKTTEPSKAASPDVARTPPVVDEPGPAPETLAPATFEDVVMLVPADRGREEVEVRVTFHAERFVVFDVDAGRIVSQVFYRAPADRPSVTVLLGTPRFLTGSERWFIFATTAGELVFRLDLDASADIVTAFERRSGIRVLRRTGEFLGSRTPTIRPTHASIGRGADRVL